MLHRPWLLVLLLVLAPGGPPAAQRSGRRIPPVDPTHITIPPMANATRTADLDYQAGECGIYSQGNTLECVFYQALVSPDASNPGVCGITTNSYTQYFQRQSATRWVSNVGPEGVCGVVTVTTLQQEPGGHFTLETRKAVTNKPASALCRRIDERPEVLTTRNTRRRIACETVEPLKLTGTDRVTLGTR